MSRTITGVLLMLAGSLPFFGWDCIQRHWIIGAVAFYTATLVLGLGGFWRLDRT